MLRSLSDMVDMTKRAVESSQSTGATEKTKAAIVCLCPSLFVNAAAG
jgi:hypothetical protein